MTGPARSGRGAPVAPGLGRKVAALVAPWRRQLGVVGICVVASALAGLVPAFVVRHVVNDDLVVHRTAGLLTAAVVYLAAAAAGAASTFAYAYLAARVSQSAIAEMRVRLFAHASALPASYFDRAPIGDLISRATADVETVDELFTDGVATLVGQLVALVATAAAMIALSPLLSAIAAGVLPALILATRFLQVRVREAQRATRVAVGRLNVELSEVVGGAETVRAFGRQSAFVARFEAALGRTLLAQRSSFGYNALFAPVSGLLSSFVIAGLVWVGAGGTLAGAGVDLGTLTAFILLFQNFFTPIVALGDEWQSVQAAVAGAERVFEVLDLPAEAVPEAGTAGNGHAPGIELREVGFSYLAGRPALIDVSLTVERGQHLAVVGRSGAGKSTLVTVAGGLHAPDTGVVRLAGVDPRTLDDTGRRRLVGVVPQTLQLFSGTLRENLSLFDPSVPDDALWQALELAGIAGLVTGLPDGLDTVLAGQGGGDGAVLSAGQRQLVTLARAVVLRPAVLLLDEATAVVDGASDAALRAALRASMLRQGTAVLTVAHRIATARGADRVAVMEAGRVVELGSPEQLLAAGGRFAAFADLEAAGWDWQEPSPAGGGGGAPPDLDPAPRSRR